MIGKAINTLTYTGIVTLSQYRGHKKVKVAETHNTGKSRLFDFLSDCLAGNFDVATINRPTKIRLLKYKTDADGEPIKYSYESASPDFIYLTTTPKKTNNADKGSVTYSFIVSREHLINGDFDGIGLYTDSEYDIDNVAAFCEKPESFSVNSLSASAVLVIDWMLNISNPGGTN